MVGARSPRWDSIGSPDARYDGLNPRTAGRELPAGRMSPREAKLFVAVWSAVFVWRPTNSAAVLRALARRARDRLLVLAREALHLVHAGVSGLAMAVAPVGGGLPRAVGADGAVAARHRHRTWVGGFDVLYACQDLEFDRAHGLTRSRSGSGSASLAISRGLHVVTVAALASLAWVTPLGPIYWLASPAWPAAGIRAVARAGADLSRVKMAFDLNGWVGILYFVTTGCRDLCPLKHHPHAR